MSKHIVSTVCILMILFLSTVIGAQIPQLINYQAYITDAEGNPEHGPLSMVYSIYDAPTEGNLIWTETKVDTAKTGM